MQFLCDSSNLIYRMERKIHVEAEFDLHATLVDNEGHMDVENWDVVGAARVTP